MEIDIPLTISIAAAREAKNIMHNKNIPEGYALRIGIKGGGGCGSGVSYLIGFDKPKPIDKSFEFEGLPIVIEAGHVLYLAGVLLDFEDTQEGRGFTFSSPADRIAEEH